MAYIFSTGSQGPATIGDVNVSVDPYTEGELKAKREQVVGKKTFPAGAYEIRIKAMFGPGQEMSVNGEELSFEGEYHKVFREDKINNKIDLLPEIVVDDAEGLEWWYSVEYPSSNPIIIANL